MNRRSFMSTILALGMAPAIVRADSLMRIVPRETVLITPEMIAAERTAWGAAPSWSADSRNWQRMKPNEHGVYVAPSEARFIRTNVSTLSLQPSFTVDVASAKLYPRMVDTIGNSFASCSWARTPP